MLSIRARLQAFPIFLAGAVLGASPVSLHATVRAISVNSPNLSPTGVTNVVSPVHFEATTEGSSTVTGYVVYVDNQNVYRNFSPSLDAWVLVPPGKHTVLIKAWDPNTNLSTAGYSINVTGFAPPTPPAKAHRLLNLDHLPWIVDNNPNVGGNCNGGSIGSYASSADPDTRNAPAFDGNGQHFILNSQCSFDDSLFYRKFTTNQGQLAGDTNFLWDFWFYIPATTKTSAVQALEFDFFQAVDLSDGVHEFMFGSQCNYASNQWQIWLPQNGSLTWVDAGMSPCRFLAGAWHHATYFLQRVTPAGYQEIPRSFGPLGDTNTSLRFGTLSVDGTTNYFGGLSYSTIPNPAWTPVLGVQHQLDSAVSGAKIEEYVDQESVTSW